MRKAIDILKAISDENRLRIVFMLRKKPMCVCELCEVLGLASSTISAHLKNLRFAGIIDMKKDGRWVEYFLINNGKMLSLLTEIEKLIDNKNNINSDIEKSKKIDRVSASSRIYKT